MHLDSGTVAWIIQADHNASLLVVALWVLREIQQWYWNRFHRKISVAIDDIGACLLGISSLLSIKEGEQRRLQGIERYHARMAADAAEIGAFKERLYSQYPELRPELKTEGDGS